MTLITETIQKIIISIRKKGKNMDAYQAFQWYPIGFYAKETDTNSQKLKMNRK